jgi:hypothetical protein
MDTAEQVSTAEDGRARAYRSAGRIAKARMAAESPLDAEALRTVETSDIVVVSGAYDNPFLRGVIDERDDPQWWLEGSSYPIRILEPSRVEVLIESAELREKYGELPVAVLFPHGRGEVLHMISHYYLQRTELRGDRHGQAAAAYAGEKGLAIDSELAEGLAGLSVGDVESATTSTRFFANVVAAKKRKNRPSPDSDTAGASS